MSNTRSRTVVATTVAHPSVKQKRLRSGRQSSVASCRTIKSRSGLSIQVKKAQKRGSTQHHRKGAQHLRVNGARTSKRTTTNITIRRARKHSSNGSSDPTGTSGSGSSESARVSQDSSTSGSPKLPSNTPRSSEQRSMDKVEESARYPTYSHEKSARRKTTAKIVIDDSFTEFRISREKGGIQITVEEVGSEPSSPPITRSKTRHERKASASSKIGRAMLQEQPMSRLSPRSLRRARLKALDKVRKLPSSSSLTDMGSSIAGDRRGSTLKPRQHYCEPGISGHHDAPGHLQSVVRHHKTQAGSPDPGSPPPGADSASPEQEDKRGPRKLRLRIANMGVTDILHAVTNQPCFVKVVPVSTIYKLNLDDALKLQLKHIVERRHGSTVTGMGPWHRVDSCHNRLEWSSCCCLYNPLEKGQDRGSPCSRYIRPNSDNCGIDTPVLRDGVTLVPLTNAQVELLRQRLRLLDTKN